MTDRVSSTRRRRIRILILGVGLAALLVLLNIAALLLPWQVTKQDVGADNISRVSETSPELVRNLKEDVQIYWLCAGGSSDYELELFLTRFHEAGDHLQVTAVDSEDPAQMAVLKPYIGENNSLSDHSLLVVSDRRYTVLDYTDLFLFSNDVINSSFGAETFLTYDQWVLYMTQYASILQNSVTSRYFRGEAQLASAIDYVTAESIPQGYLLTGHGDEVPAEELSAYMEAYGMAELDLAEAGAIPTDADCLVLYAPETDLTEEEEALIRAFLSAGGSLLLATDPDCLSNCPRIAALGSLYGLEAVDGVVSDPDEAHYLTGPTDLLPDLNETHDVTSLLVNNQSAVIMPHSHAITVTDPRPLGVTLTPLLTTSEAGGSQVVAYAAELPVTASDGSTRTGQLVWFGSVEAFAAVADEDSLSDSLSDEEIELYEGSYALFLASFFDLRSTFRSEYENISPICMDGQSLTGISRGGAAFWSILCVAVLPGICLAAGILLWRKYRKNN